MHVRRGCSPQHVGSGVYCNQALALVDGPFTVISLQRTPLTLTVLRRTYKCIWAEIFDGANMNNNNRQPRLDSDLKTHAVLRQDVTLSLPKLLSSVKPRETLLVLAQS